MRHLTLIMVTVVLLAGCTQSPTEQTAPSSPAVQQHKNATMPQEPEPSAPGPCPYLDEGFVAETNGQRVSKVLTSTDSPHPTCFFYALTGKLQLTVRIYVGDQGIATRLVDQAAPVDTSNPADQPPGWRGGYQRIDSGAVYAVAKGQAAVIVTTNQQQSVKGREVAKQAISALAL